MNRDSITFSFPIWLPFISLSCLIALDRTSSTMLNRSDDSEHYCLVPDFRRKAFSLSPLNIMFTVIFFTYDFYYVEVISSNSLFTFFFFLNHDRISSFCQMFFPASVWIIICFFPLILLMCVLHWLFFTCWIILIFQEWTLLNYNVQYF